MNGNVSIGVLAVIFVAISNIGARSPYDVDIEASDLVVETSIGYVRGRHGGVTVGLGKPIYAFRSIPFAEPPVGELRFEPPVPKTRWSGVLDVSQKGAECLQGGGEDVRGSEDCLFLKVYTTEAPRKQKKLPVMVWVYGGAFFAGSADFDEHGPDYLLDEDIIVVSFHYRVGIFGFLSTGDLEAPGNAGLKDQVLALKWIKENIAKFGGDPDNITIFGQSAGGASIAYLLQTEQTRGLYARVIMHSGSSLSLWALTRIAPSMAQTVAEDLDLSARSSAEIVRGLKSVDAELLQAVSTAAMNYKLVTTNPSNGLYFSPVIEPNHAGAVVTGFSHQQLLEGRFNHVPMIVGYNSLEALMNTIPEVLRAWLALFDLNVSRLVPIDMNVASALRRLAIGNEVKSHYFGSALVSTSTVPTMRYISDDQFERPIQEAIRLYAPHNPVYFYKFSYEGPLWGITERVTSGVGHTEELGYVWNFDYSGSPEDYKTRDRMIKLWTNFAKTGNPTPVKDPLLQNVIWPTTGADTLVALEINKNLSIIQNPNEVHMKFWNDQYRSNGVPPFDTF